MLTSNYTARENKIAAFSLLEFFGVLAILVIIATALFPVMIKRLDQAALTAERRNLASLADGLTQHIIRSNNIPSVANWINAIGSELGYSAADVSQNRRRYARAYLIDGGGWLN